MINAFWIDAVTELDGELLADAMWMARFLPLITFDESSSGNAPPLDEKVKEPPRGGVSGTGEDITPLPLVDEKKRTNDKVTAYRMSESVVPEGDQMGSPLRAPAVAALPGTLGIGRGLRPFNRKKDSRLTLVLDEEETARISADTNVLTPVFRPAKVRALEIALVFDDTPGMTVWRDTAVEFKRLLERQGAFRDVRAWRLNADGTILPGLTQVASDNDSRSVNELLDPSSERIVLLMSDCVRSGWRNGQIAQWLESVAQSNPVAILHVLPPHLWARTGLGSKRRWLSSIASAQQNSLLKVETEEQERLEFGQEPTQGDRVSGIGVPIVGLDMRSLNLYAKLVVQGGVTVRGIIAPDLAGQPSESQPADVEQGLDDILACLRRDYPDVFYLAQCLAAAPLSVPVMRIVHSSKMPYGTTSEMAEFLLSGLVTAQGLGEYEFRKFQVGEQTVDARDRLIGMAPSSLLLEVLDVVSKYVEQQLGVKGGFDALIQHQKGTVPLPPDARRFAEIRNKVLVSLGLLESNSEGDAPSSPSREVVEAVWTQDGRWLAILGDLKVRTFEYVDGSLRPGDEYPGYNFRQIVWRDSTDLLALKEDGSVWVLNRNVILYTGTQGRATAIAASIEGVYIGSEDGHLLRENPNSNSSFEFAVPFTSFGAISCITVSSGRVFWGTVEGFVYERFGRGYSGVAGNPVVALVPIAGNEILICRSSGPHRRFVANELFNAAEVSGPLLAASSAPDGQSVLFISENDSRIIDLDGNEMNLPSDKFEPKLDRIYAFHPREPVALVSGKDLFVPRFVTWRKPYELKTSPSAPETQKEIFEGGVQLTQCELSGGKWSYTGASYGMAGGDLVAYVYLDGTTGYPNLENHSEACALAFGDGFVVVGTLVGGPKYLDARGNWVDPFTNAHRFTTKIDDIAVSGSTILCTSRKEGTKRYLFAPNAYESSSVSKYIGGICVAIRPQSDRFAIGYDDGYIEFGGSLEVGRFEKFHSEPLNALAWDPTGTYLATASSDKTSIILNSDGMPIHTLALGDEGIGVSFSHDGRILAVLSLSGQITLWSSSTWERVGSIEGDFGDYYGGVDFHPFMPLLAHFAGGSSKVTFTKVDIDALLTEKVASKDRDASEAVVAISSLVGGTHTYLGSGFVVANLGEFSYVLTCAHLAEQFTERENLLVGGQLATVVASGSWTAAGYSPDLSILRTARLRTASLALSTSHSSNETVTVLGWGSNEHGDLYQQSFGAYAQLASNRTWAIESGDLRRIWSGSALIRTGTNEVVGVINRFIDSGSAYEAVLIDRLKEIWSPDRPDEQIPTIQSAPDRVAQRRALLVGLDGTYQEPNFFRYTTRDVDLIRQALQDQGFSPQTVFNVDSKTLSREIERAVFECEDDDLFLLYVNGYAVATDDVLLVYTIDTERLNPSTGYNLLDLDRKLAKRPRLKCVVILDAGEYPFVTAALDRLVNCTVVAADLDEDRDYLHGQFSYVLAQTLISNSEVESVLTLDSLIRNMQTSKSSWISGFNETAIISRTNGLGRMPFGKRVAHPRVGWPGKRILWVDDKPINNKYLVDQLIENGATVTFALNTEQALDLLDRARFDAIVTDMGRPPDKHAGYTLLKGLTNRGLWPPTIIFAGSGTAEHRRSAILNGAITSTGDGLEVVSLLGLLFNSADYPDQLAKEQAAIWSSHINLRLGGPWRPDYNDLPILSAWARQVGLRFEVGDVLARWLYATDDWSGVQDLILDYLEVNRNNPATLLLLLAWLTVAPSGALVEDYCLYWLSGGREVFHRDRMSKEFLLALRSKDIGIKLGNSIRLALSTQTTQSLVDEWLAGWNVLPKQKLVIRNIAREKGPDDYHWSVFLDEPPETLETIRSVTYVLHDTFAEPLRQISDRTTGFELQSSGWGTFTIHMIIKYRDGSQKACHHALSFKVPSVFKDHRI